MANNKKIVPVDQARKEGKPMAANKNEFSKIIINDKDGNEYTLEFTSRVVKAMERRGFKVDVDYPNNMIEDLFQGAFQKNHRNINPDRVREIWRQQKHKDQLLQALTQLYMKPLEELMEEPEEDGNETPMWKTV